jgi:asparagine synthetase B (glutamine-hydrolysing)
MFKNKELQEFYEHKFDFSNQHKEDYGDWLRAFDNAVKKRAVDGCFMGLSSGYDSGALADKLNKLGVKFKTYTIYHNENKDVLDARLKGVGDHQIAEMSDELWKKYYSFLNGKINDKAMADHASMAVAFTFETAKNEGKTIFLASQGGDEIISDYALYPGQSTFKGVYPKDLYEWKNFREGMNREYLNEIEEIAELYGIEVRYPYLDIDLVQEFLWLSQDLKNRNYKAPLFEYLTLNNVPFEKNVKRGFNPISREAAERNINGI